MRYKKGIPLDTPAPTSTDAVTLEQVVTAIKPELEKRMQAFEDKMFKAFQKLETDFKEFEAKVKDQSNKFDNAAKTYESLKASVEKMREKINQCIDEIRVLGGRNIEKTGEPNSNTPKKTDGGFGFFRSYSDSAKGN